MAKKRLTPAERPTDAICARLAEGEPLRQICRDVGMPSWYTVYQWLKDDPEFASRFARAREAGFDAIAEECLDIADDASRDTKLVGSGDSEREAADTEWISRSKLRVETRLKLLAKWDPKRYGDKLETTLKGDPSAPVALTLNGSDVHG